MVRLEDAAIDMEPTAEFNQRCVTAIQSWQSGEMPFNDAVTQMELLLAQARRAGHIANQARAEHGLGFLQHYRGNLNTSIRHYEQARSLYLRAGNRDRAANIDLNQGENYRFKGEFNRARRLYRAAFETAHELGNLRIQTIAAVNEGLVLLTLEKLDAAQSALQRGYELAAQWTENHDALPGILCEIHHGMSVIHLARDEHQAAWDHALKALEAARTNQQPLQIGYANRTLGEVVTAIQGAPLPDLPSEPDEYFRTSVAAFREIDADAEMARTMFAQARSLAMRGRRTTAARKLQQAMIIFTRLGMVDDAARAAEAQLAVI
jgi:tetratricopeptide (TPR) repeat protein